MKNIIHQAKLDLDLVKLDVVILNHRVLLFQVQDILAEKLEEYLFAQDVVVFADGELFLEQVGEHGQKEKFSIRKNYDILSKQVFFQLFRQDILDLKK
jgi:hypothetical protein